MQPFHIVSQNLVVDLLQALIARGDVVIVTLQSLESVIVQKLYFCVHNGRLDLQNKLLHLLVVSIHPGLLSLILCTSSCFHA